LYGDPGGTASGTQRYLVGIWQLGEFGVVVAGAFELQFLTLHRGA
jgi:hypothetical protein